MLVKRLKGGIASQSFLPAKDKCETLEHGTVACNKVKYTKAKASDNDLARWNRPCDVLLKFTQYPASNDYKTNLFRQVANSSMLRTNAIIEQQHHTKPSPSPSPIPSLKNRSTILRQNPVLLLLCQKRRIPHSANLIPISTRRCVREILRSPKQISTYFSRENPQHFRSVSPTEP